MVGFVPEPNAGGATSGTRAWGSPRYKAVLSLDADQSALHAASRQGDWLEGIGGADVDIRKLPACSFSHGDGDEFRTAFTPTATAEGDVPPAAIGIVDFTNRGAMRV